MLSLYNIILRIAVAITLLSLSVGLNGQIVVLDTTIERSNPLTVSEQLDLNNFLNLAVTSGNVTAINWLMKHGASVDWKTLENATPLMLAISTNQTEAALALLNYNPDVNIVTIYSETPLLAAVKNGNLEIAEALIRDSANLELADNNGATPLHYASVYGYFYITDMLLYYEADVDSKTKDGTTPLIAAIWSGYADITDLLIQYGADCEAKDNLGFTPLMVAAQNGDTVIMEMLLKKGVNIYDVNKFNYDAFDICIRSNQKEAIEYLFRKGYSRNSKLSNTINPYEVAVKYGRPDITRILKNNQIPENNRIGFDEVTISASFKFCLHDYYTGANIVMKEPSINGGIIAGFDIKPGYTRVLVKENDQLFYQYQDKSSMGFIGIFKDIPISDNSVENKWSVNTSLVAAYVTGNKLKGTEISTGNKFRIIPSAGIKYEKGKLSITANIDYTKTNYYKIGPLWMRIGIGYNLFLDKVRAPGKNIKWY
jgi:ankyrin repeat protein